VQEVPGSRYWPVGALVLDSALFEQRLMQRPQGRDQIL
jgi:hypothetical protein